MAEKDTVFESKIKYGGVFNFSDFYSFAHEWLSEEIGLTVAEGKYTEKIKGDSKDVEVEWECSKKVTDYFKFVIDVKMIIKGMKNVEVNKSGVKINTNKGTIELKVKGVLVRDYDGKFEGTAFNKFLRSVYEKWIIASRIDEFEGKLAGACDEFLGQSKAYFDISGKK